MGTDRGSMALGPGIPDSASITPRTSQSRHRRGESYTVRADSILGGLHHEYHWVAA